MKREEANHTVSQTVDFHLRKGKRCEPFQRPLPGTEIFYYLRVSRKAIGLPKCSCRRQRKNDFH